MLARSRAFRPSWSRCRPGRLSGRALSMRIAACMIVNPGPAARAQSRAAMRTQPPRTRWWRDRAAMRPAVTADGVQIASCHSIPRVGRSRSGDMRRIGSPDRVPVTPARTANEEQQYRSTGGSPNGAGWPVTLRTLDAGGDKPIRGLRRRGRATVLAARLRLSLAHRCLSHAIARARPRRVHGNVK